MKRVLITSRSFGQASREPFDILEAAGLSYDMLGVDYTDEAFTTRIADYDALIIGAHQFSQEDMRRCKKLRIIAKHGTGVDNIPLDEAKALGITVTNVPAMNSNAVADLAFALMLDVSRGVSLTNAQVHGGQWKIHIGRDVFSKTLGLIGFGAIGKNMARRAAGFSMKVLVYDPFAKDVPEEFQNYVTLCDFDTVLTSSDIISIHTPLNDQTKDMFNTGTITRMKKAAVLVNTGRGGIINEMDLYNCMKDGHLLGAALDCTTNEPIEPGNPLLSLPNVIITPHIGMHTAEAVGAVSVACANNVVKQLGGHMPDFVVV
ncbi:MAG: phosphoglycerate dehydrogenase [Defluviitaleaceae bacterium]|nr:phosphoglycerate dehydrogenase [Defluviitaleaceae bacterium]